MRRNRESRARMKLIQEMHLDKQGQHVIDAIHHDIGTAYIDMYAAYRTVRAFGYAVRTIIDGMNALARSAAKVIADVCGADAGTLRVNAMEIGPRDIHINANVFPKVPPMEVNVQIMEEATP